MPTDDDSRSLEQELAAGESEATPVIAIGSVIAIVAAFFAIALTLAVVAYVLA